ncbi:hypothetical protein C6P43_001029 [Kluyveromyces marxianus]|nr:hypothetical protein C6P43_001029 [Kluyveromyces marxianus]
MLGYPLGGQKNTVTMTPGFKMKRPRSPDLIGIENYKRQRLIYDFEHLSLGSRSNDGVKKHKLDSGLSSFKTVVSKRMWEAVERELSGSNKNDKLYEKIFEQLRQYSMQIIKWYDWRTVIRDMWTKWCIYKNISILGYTFSNTNGNLDADMDIDMDMEFATDAETDTGKDTVIDGYGTDFDIDMEA